MLKKLPTHVRKSNSFVKRGGAGEVKEGGGI
jgi:hypothetical protein